MTEQTTAHRDCGPTCGFCNLFPAPNPAALGVGNDIVAAALAALGAFGELTYRQAERLLGMWLRADELTDDTRAQVLAYYRKGATR